MVTKNWKLAGLILVLPLVLSACSWPWRKKAPDPIVFPDLTPTLEPVSSAVPSSKELGSQIHKFKDYKELAAWLAENNNPEQIFTRGPVGLGLAESFDAKAISSENGGGQEVDYSSTNNQEAGVDEADIIKTDGQYIYALVKSELLIIKATPALAAEVVSRIVFKSRPQDIFVAGDFLAVFGSDEQIYNLPLYSTFRRYNPYAFFKTFDISDRAKPKLVRDLKFEGSYKDARLVGDYVYFLTETYGTYTSNEPLVPRVIDKDKVLSADCAGTASCFSPSVYYFDLPYSSYNFTSITAINLKDATEHIAGDIYILDSGQELYVSQNNIYITYTQYLNEYDLEQEVKKNIISVRLADEDKQRIADIESAPNHVLNIHEKKIKIAQIIDRYLASLDSIAQEALSKEIDSGLAKMLREREADWEKTIIHKIAINGSRLTYQGFGEVPGQLLNQFSLDEEGDYFRVATTRSEQWSRLNDSPTASYSNLYVLDKDLKIIGRLENLATTERIYSVRFMGDRAYIVTFKKTDPLFVISLADPTKPVVLNALKIPGFSNYLHPADAAGNKLIGLGRDAEETASGGVQVKGIKLSLYDFTDTAKPKELSNFLIGDSYSSSIALEDHRAFLYSQAKELLVVPAVLYENGRLNFSGSLVFTANNTGLELRGRIDHSDGGRSSQSDYWNGYSYYDNTAKRSLYINDVLYTFSNNFLKINSLSDLSELKSLRLTPVSDDYIITQPEPKENPVETPPAGDNKPPAGGEATDNLLNESPELNQNPEEIAPGSATDDLPPLP